MNIWTLCDIYELDAKDFEKFLREKYSYRRYKDWFFNVDGIEIVDGIVDEVIAAYTGLSNEEIITIRQTKEELRRREKEVQEWEEEKKEREHAERLEKVKSVILASGSSPEGYAVLKHIDHISADYAELIKNNTVADIATNTVCSALESARNSALQRIKEIAVEKDGNAVINVSYNHISANGCICVTVNGDIVLVEKTLLEDEENKENKTEVETLNSIINTFKMKKSIHEMQEYLEGIQEYVSHDLYTEIHEFLVSQIDAENAYATDTETVLSKLKMNFKDKLFGDDPTVPIFVGNDQIKCPCCGKMQSIDRTKCFSCGIVFTKQ